MSEDQKRGIYSRLEAGIISVAQCIFYVADRPKQRFRRILADFDQFLNFQKICALSPVFPLRKPRPSPRVHRNVIVRNLPIQKPNLYRGVALFIIGLPGYAQINVFCWSSLLSRQ